MRPGIKKEVEMEKFDCFLEKLIIYSWNGLGTQTKLY